ncbi:hypothetical protein [Sphingomonas sp.]|uniref:hypothetical protein n=1 Tax=Sphingomonas sp. TaxID=28214 RepID=UPI0035C80A30
MKSLILAAAALAACVPMVADAQAWRTINQRQANQFARIQQGIRNGALTRVEGDRLKQQFYALNRLEQRYRIGGLSLRERQDLDRRFDALSRRIYVQKRDRQKYR